MAQNTTLRTIKDWLWKANQPSIPNAEAFTHLFERTHLIVFRYVYGLSGGPLQEVEDLTAETYERAWRTRGRFQGDERAALGWLIRIARNLAIDLARRRKVREVEESLQIEQLVDPKVLPEMDVITREQIEILWQMLVTLPEEVREMIVLRYMLGWQVKQVAEHLGTSENNVSMTIRRAFKRLQRDWPQSQEQDNE